MEQFDTSPGADPQRAWGYYLLLVAIIVGAFVLMNVLGIRAQTSVQEGELAPQRALTTGDLLVKLVLAVDHLRESANLKAAPLRGAGPSDAIKVYEQARPYPAGLRRIGIVKRALLKESRADDLYELDSLQATRGLSVEWRRKLAREAAMWRLIYAPDGITPAQAREFVPRVRQLNLGPLKEVAVAEVYRQAGLNAQALEAMKRAREGAFASVAAIFVLFVLLVLAGLLGLVLLIVFLAQHAREFVRAERPKIQPAVLFITFLIYLASYLALSAAAAVLEELAGVDELTSTGAVIHGGLQVAVMLGALALGLAALRRLTAQTGEDVREMGLRVGSASRAILWGIGGYCAALPLLVVTSLISLILFSGIKTPEHPIEQYVSRSGASYALVFFLAVIAAPIVEEIFFRGALYTALRGRMSVWGAVFASAAIFALIHPTIPGQFLPLFALGSVFAVLREKTGSVVPCMISHAFTNMVTVIMLKLIS